MLTNNRRPAKGEEAAASLHSAPKRQGHTRATASPLPSQARSTAIHDAHQPSHAKEVGTPVTQHRRSLRGAPCLPAILQGIRLSVPAAAGLRYPPSRRHSCCAPWLPLGPGDHAKQTESKPCAWRAAAGGNVGVVRRPAGVRWPSDRSSARAVIRRPQPGQP